jgi:hypothetical protein
VNDFPEQGTVVLVVYSGQAADPEWLLSAQLEATIRQEIEAGTDKPPAEPGLQSVLGYRGFRVALPGSGENVRVGLGAVTLMQPDGAMRAWADTAGLEAALLQDAVQQGHGPLLDELGVSHP